MPAVTSATFLPRPHPDLAAAAARADELGLSVAEYVRALRRDAVWESALAAVDEVLAAGEAGDADDGGVRGDGGDAARPDPASAGSDGGLSG